MTEKWAYTAHGRLSNHDLWDWFGQERSREDKLYTIAGKKVFCSDNPPAHVISFDGKNWISGYLGLPETFLDPAKYPSAKYSHDFWESVRPNAKHRPIHFLHGYQSESGAFPERIPAFDKQRVAELHEKNIIPLWDKSIALGRSGRGELGERTITSFELLDHTVNLSDHLPPEAIEQLRQAHAAGKPIALNYDPTTKQWSRLHEFEQENDLERFAREAAGEKSIPPAASSAIPNEVEQVGRSFGQRFGKIHPAGKIAVIGGSVALVATLGYWIYKTTHQKAEKQAEQGAVAGK